MMNMWRELAAVLPLDADHEDELRLLVDVERAILLAETIQADLLPLCVTVFLDIGLGTFEDDATLLLVCLCKNVSAGFFETLISMKIYDGDFVFRPERWLMLATASTREPSR